VAYRHGLTDEQWHDFGTALADALAAPPDQAVAVRLRATTQQGWVSIAED
jgi:hypothetical protein